jgi:type I restriction enzyme S subunit
MWDPYYVNLSLSTSFTRDQIEIPARSTSGVHNINSDEIRRLIISLPPLPEQQEIVRRVETLFKKANEVEARHKKAKAFVDRLTQSIFAKAFRGELVPQDPNDEPASVLLEKIKAEKAKHETKGRGRKKKGN